jgi:adenylosuccinate synthase
MYYNLDKIEQTNTITLNGKEYDIQPIKIKDLDKIQQQFMTMDGQIKLIKNLTGISEDLTTEEHLAILIAIKETIAGDRINLPKLMEKVRS